MLKSYMTLLAQNVNSFIYLAGQGMLLLVVTHANQGLALRSS